MIYYLFEQLQHLDFPGSGLLQYISVRSILASVTAIVLMLCFGGKVIRGLQKLQIGEEISEKRYATWAWRGSWPRRAPPPWAAS